MKRFAMNSAKSDGTTDLAEPGVAVGETIMAYRETKTPRVIGVGDVALNARDPAALAELYREVLGFQVVPTETSDLGENVFLSSHPAEVSVDLALFRNPAFQHTAFEVRSLADLRAFHQRVLDRNVPVKLALNHGVSLSFYFDDPEGHSRTRTVSRSRGERCCGRSSCRTNRQGQKLFGVSNR